MNFVILTFAIVYIILLNMILTMMMKMSFMSLLKQYRMVEQSFIRVIIICVELMECLISSIQIKHLRI